MDQDEPEGQVDDRGVQDFPRVGPRRVEGPDRERLPGDQVVLLSVLTVIDGAAVTIIDGLGLSSSRFPFPFPYTSIR